MIRHLQKLVRKPFKEFSLAHFHRIWPQTESIKMSTNPCSRGHHIGCAVATTFVLILYVFYYSLRSALRDIYRKIKIAPFGKCHARYMFRGDHERRKKVHTHTRTDTHTLMVGWLVSGCTKLTTSQPSWTNAEGVLVSCLFIFRSSFSVDSRVKVCGFGFGEVFWCRLQPLELILVCQRQFSQLGLYILNGNSFVFYPIVIRSFK